MAASAAALACMRSRAAFRSSAGAAAVWGCCAATAVADTSAAASLRRVSFMVHLDGSVAWPFPASASSAAFSMTERGAASPVQISNWRTACSMNISMPGHHGLALLPGAPDQHGFERVVHHVEHDLGGNVAVEEALVHMREHAQRRGVHQRVEMALVQLLAQQRLRRRRSWPARGRGRHCGPPGDLAPGIGSARRPRCAPRPPLPTISTEAFASRTCRAERTSDAGRIGIGAAPFPGLAPHRVDRADAARQRVHDVQVANDFLLVRNGDAEAGEWAAWSASEKKSRKHAGRHQERQIHRVHAPRLERAVVHGRRNRMPDRVGNHAVDLWPDFASFSTR